jgi:glycosyltransferase involved in cell wall biosynthesis
MLFAQGAGAYWEAARKLDCPVTTLGLSNGRDVSGLRRTARAMAPHTVHHFHSTEPLLMLGSLQCRSVARVYTHRGGIIDYPWRKRVRHAIVGFMLRHAFHGISGNTAHAADCASRLFGIDRGGIRVTYNGLDFSLLESRRPVDAVRAELGVVPDDFVLGTAAELRRWKRIDRLVELLTSIDEPRLRLLIVGDGEDRDRLEGLVRQLGVANRVTFAGPQANIGDHLQLMQAFCLPSMGLESFGNAAVEAMAEGIPTIVFADGGGMVEHIDSGETGFIVDDQRGLEEVVTHLIHDPELRRRIADRGRDTVRERYSLDRADASYEALYRSAIARANLDA